MRQSEYTTPFYERRGKGRGNIKFPVRGKLFMLYRGRSIYEKDGRLTDGLSGFCFPQLRAEDGEEKVREQLEKHWHQMNDFIKRQRRVWWRSKRGGVTTINGIELPKKSDVKCIPY